MKEKKEEMREKLVMIAMNAAFEDMYSLVFAPINMVHLHVEGPVETLTELIGRNCSTF